MTGRREDKKSVTSLRLAQWSLSTGTPSGRRGKNNVKKNITNEGEIVGCMMEEDGLKGARQKRKKGTKM